MRKEIISALLDRNIITNEQLQAAESAVSQGGISLEEYFYQKNIIDEEALTQLRAELYNIPYADLTDIKVPSEVINIVPIDTAKTYEVVVFKKEDAVISVGLVDPKNFKAIEAIEFLAQKKQLKVQYSIISLSQWKVTLKFYHQLGEEVSEVLDIAKERFVEAGDLKSEEFGDEKLEVVLKSAPVSKIVSVIISNAYNQQVSDIHIEPYNRETTRVRYRVDGVLKTVIELPSYIHSAIVSRIKVLANLKLDETRVPQDGRIRTQVGQNEVDLRVSMLPLLDSEKVVMRLLKSGSSMVTLTDLGYRQKYVDMIKSALTKSHGLLLVTGPTGSGKSTTLSSALDILNNNEVNIVTLEDPAEYSLQGVNQSQVNSEVGYNFASGLRAILRQDPDIVMVGEIRDEETAELVIHAALTGHIVFSTLHTRNSIGTIPRLMDIGVEPYLISSTIEQIIAQRLVRQLCPDCKAPFVLSDKIAEEVRAELKNIPSEYLPNIQLDKEITIYRSEGCVKCGETGYRGRTTIAEILNFSDELKQEINDGWSEERVRNLIISQGFITMKQDGFLKVMEGITSIEEVLRVMKI